MLRLLAFLCIRNVRRALTAFGAALSIAQSSIAYAQDPTPGSLHTSPFPGFASGTGKIANLAIGSGVDGSNAIALQADGKIVLAGECVSGGVGNFCVARLNADGSLDQSFQGPNGNGGGKFLLPIGAGGGGANAVAVQGDGKIVIAGYCYNGADDDFCLARLSVDGSLDTSFDGPSGSGDGKFLLAISAFEDYAHALTLQSDGKMVLAGQCGSAIIGHGFCAVRLNADGSFDTSFGGPSGTGNGVAQVPFGTVGGVAYAVAVQPDGKIVLAGTCAGDFCVARLNAGGSFDTSFVGPSGASNGNFTLPIGSSSDFAASLALQADGKLVLAGNCYNGVNDDFCVARLNVNGSLDASFDGPSGFANGKFLLPMGAGNDAARAAAVQSDGKIVIAGHCFNGANTDFCVARLNVDGSLDTSFDGPIGNGNGQVLLPIGAGSDVAKALALQTDGRIVVAGYCYNGSNDDMCVARLNGGPYGAKHCSLDLDGDGKVVATVDMLIGTRVAMGLTGDAVIGGIVFAPHATRKNWPDIRSYLVAQCGMTLAP